MVKRNDGTFDLFLNRALDRSRVPEVGLTEELCVRFGYCGEEYHTILREVSKSGRTTLRFWRSTSKS